MEVWLGEKQVTFPSEYLQELEPCNGYLNSREKLLQSLKDKGYLFIKSFFNSQDIYDAKNAILLHLKNTSDQILNEDVYSWKDGILNHRCGKGCLPFMEGRNDITHNRNVLQVIESNKVKEFFGQLFDSEAITFDFKWLRAMHKGGFTGAHVDNVYMSRGSSEVLTMWTPFGDTPANMGVLAVCESSNHSTRFHKLQNTYGNCDLEKENVSGTGWFTTDPDEISKMGGKWKTAHFEAGDAIIFTLRTIHMTTTNTTDKVRLSCDTRWQPAADKVDSRFFGNFSSRSKFGIYGEETTKYKEVVTVTDLKKSWGF